VFVAKSYLEERLQQVESNSNHAFQLQLDKNAGILMSEINKEIAQQVALTIATKSKEGLSAEGLSEAAIIKIVKGVLAVYDADKTGLVDFALETAGGQVLSTRCTESYQTRSAEISIFGIPLWYPSNTPRTVISPSVQPGECWAFQGFPGYIVIQLNNPIRVTGFTIEHIPQSLAPGGVIDSAPNNFTVWVGQEVCKLSVVADCFLVCFAGFTDRVRQRASDVGQLSLFGRKGRAEPSILSRTKPQHRRSIPNH